MRSIESDEMKYLSRQSELTYIVADVTIQCKKREQKGEIAHHQAKFIALHQAKCHFCFLQSVSQTRRNAAGNCKEIRISYKIAVAVPAMYIESKNLGKYREFAREQRSILNMMFSIACIVINCMENISVIMRTDAGDK